MSIGAGLTNVSICAIIGFTIGAISSLLPLFGLIIVWEVAAADIERNNRSK